MARGRRAKCLRQPAAAMDDSRVWHVAIVSWVLERHASCLGDGPSDARPDFDLSGCPQALDFHLRQDSDEDEEDEHEADGKEENDKDGTEGVAHANAATTSAVHSCT